MFRSDFFNRNLAKAAFHEISSQILISFGGSVMEKPTLPKGTRDFGPAQMAKRQFIFDTIKHVFQKYGFQPLETPAIENLSTLTGKYGEEGDTLLFKILNSGDYLKDVEESKLATRNSKLTTFDISEKGLRYDLTVPFARYVVMNRHEITFPFKRYQIQPVWRADRPQKGRYREFYQCDADVVGTDSLICEAEIILMIKEVFKGLGIIDYIIKINHRAVLEGMANMLGTQEKHHEFYTAIDKLEKIGEQKVREELISKGFREQDLGLLFDNFLGHGERDQIVYLRHLFQSSDVGTKGVSEIDKVFTLLKDYGSDLNNIEFDLSLARGLSYYTGCIFEVKINNVSIGSVSGGGRYDNLTGVFDSKDKNSGVGFSFGVDRLYDAMEEIQKVENRELFPKKALISSNILICHFDEASKRYGLKVLQALRTKGIASEIYPDTLKIQKQLDYANKKSIPFVIVIGSDEVNTGLLTLKNMEKGEQQKMKLEEILKLQF